MLIGNLLGALLLPVLILFGGGDHADRNDAPVPASGSGSICPPGEPCGVSTRPKICPPKGEPCGVSTRPKICPPEKEPCGVSTRPPR